MIPSDTVKTGGALDDIGAPEPPAGDIGGTLEIDISVRAAQWNAVDDLDGLARLAVTAALRAGAEFLPDHPTEISLVFADADFVAALNAKHRGRPGPTNVLSFPASDGDDFGATLLGDVVLAYEVVAGEALDQGLALPDHVAHLLVHGTLHLLGHDHILESDAQIMEALEIDILKTLNIANPYAI